jgi:hypothetical protein
MDHVRLVDIAGLVKGLEGGAALREKAHVAIVDAGEQQVVCSVLRALDVGKYKVQASAHGRLLTWC